MLTVLEGTADCTLDGKPVTLNAGEVVFLPANISHSFRNATDHMLRVQFIALPAESFEAFFGEFSEFPLVAADTRPDMPRLAALLEKYGMRFVDA